MSRTDIRKQNLKILIDEAGTNAELARRTGVNEQYISQIVTGVLLPSGKPRGIGNSTAEKLEDGMGKARGWLDERQNSMGIEEPSLTYHNTNDIAPLAVTDESEIPLRVVELPFLKETEDLGDRRHQETQKGSEKLLFPTKWLQQKGIRAEDAVCLNATGSSMAPVLPDGAAVAADTSNTTITDGKIYAINHSGTLRLRLLYNLPGSGIRLRSFNSCEYPDEIYQKEDMGTIIIIGEVFWYSALL